MARLLNIKRQFNNLTNPMQRYQQDLAQGNLLPDASQLMAVESYKQVFEALQEKQQ